MEFQLTLGTGTSGQQTSGDRANKGSGSDRSPFLRTTARACFPPNSAAPGTTALHALYSPSITGTSLVAGASVMALTFLVPYQVGQAVAWEWVGTAVLLSESPAGVGRCGRVFGLVRLQAQVSCVYIKPSWTPILTPPSPHPCPFSAALCEDQRGPEACRGGEELLWGHSRPLQVSSPGMEVSPGVRTVAAIPHRLCSRASSVHVFPPASQFEPSTPPRPPCPPAPRRISGLQSGLYSLLTPVLALAGASYLFAPGMSLTEVFGFVKGVEGGPGGGQG